MAAPSVTRTRFLKNICPDPWRSGVLAVRWHGGSWSASRIRGGLPRRWRWAAWKAMPQSLSSARIYCSCDRANKLEESALEPPAPSLPLNRCISPGRDQETLSELSEAPTDNASACAAPTGSGCVVAHLNLDASTCTLARHTCGLMWSGLGRLGVAGLAEDSLQAQGKGP